MVQRKKKLSGAQWKHLRKQKKAPYNRDLLRFLTSSWRFSQHPGKKYQGLYWGMDYGPICGLVLRRTTSPPPKLELVVTFLVYNWLCWFGHVQCIQDSRRAKQAPHLVSVKNRNWGRPHITVGRDNEATETAWDNVCLKVNLSVMHLCPEKMAERINILFGVGWRLLGAQETLC